MTNDVGRAVRCGCGGPLLYSHNTPNGEQRQSCNKYMVCMTWDEQNKALYSLMVENKKMRAVLEKIASVNACDYEYRTWAKEALNT